MKSGSQQVGLGKEVANPIASLGAFLAATVGTGAVQKKYIDGAGDSFRGEGFKDWLLRKRIQGEALLEGYAPKTVDLPEKAHVEKFIEPTLLGLMKGRLATAPGTSPGVMAHELGHIKQPLNPRLYGLSLTAPMLGTLGVATMPTSKSKLLAAMAGTAGSLPSLGYELDASRRGRNILKDYDYDKPMEAFAGTPTYAANAAMPLGAYGLRKLIMKILTKGKA